MKVICKKIFNHHTQKLEQKSPWITVDKEYIVLGIEIFKDKVLYLIVTDSNQQPGLQNAIQLDIISHFGRTCSK